MTNLNTSFNYYSTFTFISQPLTYSQKLTAFSFKNTINVDFSWSITLIDIHDSIINFKISTPHGEHFFSENIFTSGQSFTVDYNDSLLEHKSSIISNLFAIPTIQIDSVISQLLHSLCDSISTYYSMEAAYHRALHI